MVAASPPIAIPAVEKAGESAPIAIWVIMSMMLVGVVVAVVLFFVYARGSRKAHNREEAKTSLIQAAKDAANAYERRRSICPSASRPVPATMDAFNDVHKYLSSSEEWLVDKPNDAGFACIGFSVAEPLSSQLSYTGTATGFTISARGMFGEKDDTISILSVNGIVYSDGALALDPVIHETPTTE
jgi:hypothetical protein